MLVKPDQTGDYGVTGQVENLCCRRDRDRTACTDPLYPPIAQQNRLIETRWPTGAIDQGDARKGNEKGVNREKSASPRRKRRSLSGTGH